MRHLLLILTLLLLAAPTLAFEGPSAALGQTLFTSPALGTSGKSCSSCHPDGRGLELISRLGDPALKATVNNCIRGPLAGEALDPDSTEMNSLILFLRSLGKEPASGQ